MYRILEQYLRLNRGIYGVEEILNPFYGEYTDSTGRITLKSTANSPQGQEWDDLFAERFKLAQKHHNKIFYKVFPSAFRPNSMDWLQSNHLFVSHERKDSFEQALSFMVSSLTNTWYEEGGLKLAPKSLKGEQRHFRRIEGIIFHYHQLKRTLKPIAEFDYETFLKKQPIELLREQNLNEPFTDEGLKQTSRHNLRPKLELFSNAAEIKRWYKDSFLQQISPLKR